MTTPVFHFEPRWKEELVCRSALGEILAQMPMGVLTIYWPTESDWQEIAPEWALPHYEGILSQLRAWSESKGIPVRIEEKGVLEFF